MDVPEISSCFSPSFAGKVPQPYSIPCRGRLWILFHQLVRQHEQGGP